jgi:hypothetical protein
MNCNIETRLANIEAHLRPAPDQTTEARHEQKPSFDYEGFRVLSEQFFMSLPESIQKEVL